MPADKLPHQLQIFDFYDKFRIKVLIYREEMKRNSFFKEFV